jgi:GMP synthase (glutamine-hydrolysing)
MKTCLAIRHVAFEDLGTFADALAERGFAIRYVEAGYDDLAGLGAEDADLLAVLGGPIGANDEALYPFLADELRLVEARLKADRPLLGICLGAQVMARALGARVYANPAGKEIGWSRLSLTPAGQASPLAGLAAVDVLHWHGDTFDLPHGAELLASTPRTPHQAFAWGLSGLALQFHPEVSGRGLEKWFIGHAGELSGTSGVTLPELRAATHRAAPRLEEAGRAAFAAWLDRIRPPGR